MSRKAALFSQADITKAVKGVKKAGLPNSMVRIDPQGRIEVATGNPPAQDSPFVDNQIAKLCLADAERVFQHGFEHWLEIIRGAGDDFEYFGSGALMLARFCKLPGLLAKPFLQVN